MRGWGLSAEQTGQKCTRQKKKLPSPQRSHGDLGLCTGSTLAQLTVLDEAIHIHDLLPPSENARMIEITPGQRTNYIFAKYCPSRECDLITQQAMDCGLDAVGAQSANNAARGGIEMNSLKRAKELQAGKVGWILLWALGVPIPLLLIFFLMRGCT